MSRMVKFAFVGAIAVLGAGAPVFAQSFTSTFGTGNAMSTYYDQSGALQIGSPDRGQSQLAARQTGASAFAMVPEVTAGSFSRSLTGGGSIGYNQKLLQD